MAASWMLHARARVARALLPLCVLDRPGKPSSPKSQATIPPKAAQNQRQELNLGESPAQAESGLQTVGVLGRAA